MLDNGFSTDPRLQIWRRQSSSSNMYTIAHEIPLFTCNAVSLSGPSTVHECALSTGLDVQVGDILGMSLPRTQNRRNRFEVYFDSSFASSTYFREGESTTTFSNDQTGGTVGTPLVAFEVTPNGKHHSIMRLLHGKIVSLKRGPGVLDPGDSRALG